MPSSPLRPQRSIPTNARARITRSLGPALIVAVLALLYAGYMKVKLVGDDATAREEWSTMERLLDERAQLALEFANVVRELATAPPTTDDQDALESALQGVEGAVRRLGDPALSSPIGSANADVALSGALGKLLDAVKTATALRENARYQQSLSALADSAGAVSDSRSRYNAIVKKENKLVKGFPGKFVAPLFKFEAREFFNAVGEEETKDSTTTSSVTINREETVTTVEPLPPASEK